jgi:hypothetical protein
MIDSKRVIKKQDEKVKEGTKQLKLDAISLGTIHPESQLGLITKSSK